MTLLLEDIFSHIPKTYHSIKTFLENIIQLAKSKNYKMIQEKSFMNPGDYENFLEIFFMYEKLYEVHFSLQTEISTLKWELNEFSTWQVFLTPTDIWEQEGKKLKVFSTGKQNFLHEIKELKLNGSHMLDDIKLEKKTVWNGELLKMKKEIFSKLFSLMEFIVTQWIDISELHDLKIDDIEKIKEIFDISSSVDIKKIRLYNFIAQKKGDHLKSKITSWKQKKSIDFKS